MARRWKIDVDAIVGVGTVYRTSKAVSAHVSGDHDEAKRQWTEAGINLAGDALGMVTAGAGKLIMNKVGRKGVKTAVKAATNRQEIFQTAKKKLTKKAMKGYAKKYFNKKTVQETAKEAVKEALVAYIKGDSLDDVIADKMEGFIDDKMEDLLDKVADATGANRDELNELEEQEIIELAQTFVEYDDCY